MTRDTIVGGPSADPGGTGGGDEPDEDGGGPPPGTAGDAATAGNLAGLYSLIALGFERPGEEFSAALEDRAFRRDLPALARGVDGDVASAAEAVGDHVEAAESLHEDWASLFGVEEGVSVSPYELTYLPGPLVTNVRRLADINGFYSAFDLAVVEGANDRGDHVCFQAEFLHHLALREAYLRRTGDDEGIAVVLDARREFLEDHLGRWFWRFADEVATHDDGFYAALAGTLAALVEVEIDRLELDPEWVPDDPQAAEWTEDVFGDSGRTCGSCGVGGGDTGPPEDGGIPHGHPVGESPTNGDGSGPAGD